MVALDDTAVGLRLAGLDHLVFVVRDVELEAVLRSHGGGTGLRVSDSSATRPFLAPLLGLGGMTVLRYTRVFRNTDGMIFNTVKNTDAFLSISVVPHNKTERRKLID